MDLNPSANTSTHRASLLWPAENQNGRNAGKKDREIQRVACDVALTIRYESFTCSGNR